MGRVSELPRFLLLADAPIRVPIAATQRAGRLVETAHTIQQGGGRRRLRGLPPHFVSDLGLVRDRAGQTAAHHNAERSRSNRVPAQAVRMRRMIAA
jgi:hypothetical protein